MSGYLSDPEGGKKEIPNVSEEACRNVGNFFLNRDNFNFEPVPQESPEVKDENLSIKTNEETTDDKELELKKEDFTPENLDTESKEPDKEQGTANLVLNAPVEKVEKKEILDNRHNHSKKYPKIKRHVDDKKDRTTLYCVLGVSATISICFSAFLYFSSPSKTEQKQSITPNFNNRVTVVVPDVPKDTNSKVEEEVSKKTPKEVPEETTTITFIDKGEIKYEYTGPIVNNEFHGKGKYTYTDYVGGNKYSIFEGSFSHNQYDYGTIKWLNDDGKTIAEYTGKWKDGERYNGVMKYLNPDGTVTHKTTWNNGVESNDNSRLVQNEL